MVDRHIAALLQDTGPEVLRDRMAAVCPCQECLIACRACRLIPRDQALTVLCVLPFDKSAFSGLIGNDHDGDALRSLQIVCCLRRSHCDGDHSAFDACHCARRPRRGHCRNCCAGGSEGVVCCLPGTAGSDLHCPFCDYGGCCGFQCQCLRNPGDRKGLCDTSGIFTCHTPDYNRCDPCIGVIGIAY